MKVGKEKTEILLMEYAAGALDEASALLAASYVTVCPDARRYVKDCERFGGALMEECDPVAMFGASLKTVLGRLDDSQAAPACPPAASGVCGGQKVPQPVAAHVSACGQQAKWRAIRPGLRYCRLPVSDGRHAAMLVRLAPGTKAPRHRHCGDELTLVLEGGYADEYGHYRAGDLVIAEDGTAHTPVADRAGCTCIVVTETPIRFTGSIYAVLNFFMR